MYIICATLIAIFALGLSIAPGPARADLGAKTALELARAQWFEGIPDDHLDPLSEEAHRALRELLSDPDEIAHHATAIEILGRAGGSSAFEILSGYEQRTDEENSDGEEISGDEHRARLALLAALGHLARHDDRALQRLLRETDAPSTKRWRTKRISAEQTTQVHREMCAVGLGLSGREEAAQALQRMRQAGDSAAWRRHIDASLDMYQRNAGGRAR